MKQVRTAANLAGARRDCARNRPVPAFPPVMRGALMPVVRTLRQELKLSTGDLLVLGALLSFLPCKDRETGTEVPISPDMILVVFAGNAALCERSNGMDERVLRRHLGHLVEAGLISRKQSATGKRFPLKRDGLVRDAFGLDLTPLLERYSDLAVRAQEVRREAEELRTLRAEALATRAELLGTAVPLEPETVSFLDRVKTVLRRSTLTLEIVTGLLRTLQDMLRGTVGSKPPALPYETAEPTPIPCPSNGVETRNEGSCDANEDETRTTEMSARNGQRVRHKDSSQIKIKKRTTQDRMRDLWNRCGLAQLLHPVPPETEHGLLQVIYELGQMSRFDDQTLASAMRQIGPNALLETLDHIAQNMSQIRCRFAYLEAVVRRRGQGVTPSW